MLADWSETQASFDLLRSIMHKDLANALRLATASGKKAPIIAGLGTLFDEPAIVERADFRKLIDHLT
jgi:hypothetical protein